MFLKDKVFTNWGRNIRINPKRFSPKNYGELKNSIVFSGAVPILSFIVTLPHIITLGQILQ